MAFLFLANYNCLNPLYDNQDQLFCKNCYDENFMSHDYTTNTYGGIVTPEDIRRKEEDEKKRLEKAERAKRERRCPTCDMKVHFLDSDLIW